MRFSSALLHTHHKEKVQSTIEIFSPSPVCRAGRNGIDVDKFDYLERDSRYCGIKVSCDPGRIMQFSKVRPGASLADLRWCVSPVIAGWRNFKSMPCR